MTRYFNCRLPDEWSPLETAPTTKSIKMGMLPESTKNKLQQELHLTRPSSQQQFTKHPRKRKAQPAAQQIVPAEMSSSTQAAVIPPSSKQRRLMSSKSSLSPAAIAKLFMWFEVKICAVAKVSEKEIMIKHSCESMILKLLFECSEKVLLNVFSFFVQFKWWEIMISPFMI